MKKIKDPLKTIAKSLLSLSKKVEKIAKQADALMPSKPVPAAKKTVAKKTAPKKAVAKKTAAKKKPPAAKVAPPKQLAVLDSVFDSIKRAKKGVTVAQIKEKLDLNAKQLSNALYKLSKKGKIEAKSRGLYFKK
jgi:predicted Rossmann fold nucleotide-binding protein DprA/Smf involved in DNA uptake